MTDGRGGVVTQTVPVLVTNQVTNHALTILDSPTVKRTIDQQGLTEMTIDPQPQLAVANQIYAYNSMALTQMAILSPRLCCKPRLAW